MTFTPANGIGKWYPPETDIQLGKLFTFPPPFVMKKKYAMAI